MSEAFEDIKRLFESNGSVNKACRHLKNGAAIGLTIQGEDEPLHFIMQGKDPAVSYGACAVPTDIDLLFTPGAIRRLSEQETDSIGDMGLLFLQLMASHDPEYDIVIKSINAGFLSFARKGYFSVVAAAGPKVLGFLAKKGLGNPAGLKRAIDRRRKKK